MIGYSVDGARKFMNRLGVPTNYVGNKCIYYLSDLQTYAPELYASILEANNLNQLIKRQEKDDVIATPQQFKY